MKLSTKAYKGTRDFYPEDKRIQKYMFGAMRQAVESFGYEEYDAPILEPIELYLAKTGEEIVNEQTYVFEDRGGRKVTIRPEMTPTVSRMVAAKRQELSYPLRWYSIPNLWRYERPQRGRLREHWQLNVDIFGVEGLQAEHEIIQVIDAIMKQFSATRSMYEIRLNSRKLMDFIFTDYLQLSEDSAHKTAKLIDRMNKMPADEFKKLATELLEEENTGKLISVLEARALEDLPPVVQQHSSWNELSQLLRFVKEGGIDNARFDITIMRGFDYYTDIVFEVFDANPENNRSMFGGGRYDGLVSQFGVEAVPTVGFGMGDVTLQNFLESHELLPKLASETNAYVVLIGDVYEKAADVVAGLRHDGLNVAVDLSGRKPDKQIKIADKKAIKYAVFIGEDELAKNLFVLKNLATGEEQSLSVGQIAQQIKESPA